MLKINAATDNRRVEKPGIKNESLVQIKVIISSHDYGSDYTLAQITRITPK